MAMLGEFADFLKKYQVLGLAVAFVMGAEANKVVTAIVTDLVMPIVNVLLPGGNWQTATFTVGQVNFLVGDFLSVMIDFVIVALVIFLAVKYLMQEDAKPKGRKHK
jgi:large conductance mechanosensitive channel